MKTLEKGLGEREYIESFMKVKKFLESNCRRELTEDDARSIRGDLENILQIYQRVRSFDSAARRVTLSNQVRGLLRMLGHTI
jgi:hypothetical protein